MATVGLTGATGFIGGAVLPALLASGYEVRSLDNRSGPVRVEYPDRPVPNLDFASDAGLAQLRDCDVLLHLAAVSGVMACASDPVGSARTNIAGTARLFEQCRVRRIPVAFASSFAVVGSPDRLPVTEATPARPTHEYARQKAEGERLVEWLGREGGVATAAVRQSNVYGGYRANSRYIAKGNVIQVFAQQVGSGRLTVNAPGTQRRDFVHLEDVVAHWLAVARYLLRGGTVAGPTTINVASGESLSVLEVADKVAACYHRWAPTAGEVRIEVVPNPRGGVELVEPSFAVSRVETERRLGVRCQQTVESALPAILGESGALSPRSAGRTTG